MLKTPPMSGTTGSLQGEHVCRYAWYAEFFARRSLGQ